jgi:hypothetical protein
MAIVRVLRLASRREQLDSAYWRYHGGIAISNARRAIQDCAAPGGSGSAPLPRNSDALSTEKTRIFGVQRNLESTQRRKTKMKNGSCSVLLLLIGSCLIGLLLGETMLRMFTVFPIHSSFENRQRHPALGHVMDPASPEIDAFGFRNSEAGDHSDIVAIGDSHTYGFNVSSASSWPQLVSRHTGLSVYNFGIGAYGFLHYKYVFDLALARRPRMIILGLYVPNDLGEMCRETVLNHWKSYLTEHHFRSQMCPTARTADNRLLGNIKDALGNVAIASAAHFLLADRWRMIGGPSVEVVYGSHRTAISVDLVSRYAQEMDFASPIVVETYRMAQLILKEIIERCRQQNVEFAVLVIPSKQNVLAHLIDKEDPF